MTGLRPHYNVLKQRLRVFTDARFACFIAAILMVLGTTVEASHNHDHYDSGRDGEHRRHFGHLIHDHVDDRDHASFTNVTLRNHHDHERPHQNGRHDNDLPDDCVTCAIAMAVTGKISPDLISLFTPHVSPTELLTVGQAHVVATRIHRENPARGPPTTSSSF